MVARFPERVSKSHPAAASFRSTVTSGRGPEGAKCRDEMQIIEGRETTTNVR